MAGRREIGRETGRIDRLVNTSAAIWSNRTTSIAETSLISIPDISIVSFDTMRFGGATGLTMPETLTFT
jgi:hypothetical protein